jgi:Kef-type K+ transport system membrane component KefB
VPSIVAYIGAESLLGPAFGVLEVTHAAELISGFGIILLLFLMGPELSLDKIRAVGSTAFVTGGVQMELEAALALTVFVMVVRPLLLVGVLPQLGHGEESSFQAGLSLAQISGSRSSSAHSPCRRA